jgi:PAS domain S-box-containing protein
MNNPGTAQAKSLVCVLGLIVAVVDLFLPGDLNFAILYCFVVVLCAWTRSFVFLWSAAAVFATGILAGLLVAPPPVTGPISWVDWSNRIFALAALALVAVFTHVRMRGFQYLEQVIASRKRAEQALGDSEARLRLAQRGGRVGSWEWDPSDGAYRWSDECYDIFGIQSAEKSTEAWKSAIDPEDLSRVEKAMRCCLEGEECDFEYRYHHPGLGTRWIHASAKMFTSESRFLCMFGIVHDVTDRKHLEELRQQSHSVLESLVNQRTAELRKLSLTLLRSQDEEHRRIARELHDSFGQYLASLKINLDILGGLEKHDGKQELKLQIIIECLNTVQLCIQETRTLSHLLHPPLLDEAGFVSAARWYVEEFSRRSAIETRFEVPPQFNRLSPALELALFRALQESLTNIHRYAGSSKVDISLVLDNGAVELRIQDYGCGIPAEKLQNFREHGSGVGVGLSGMRERLAELGGRLEIDSDARGTTICARAPVHGGKAAPCSTAKVA